MAEFAGPLVVAVGEALVFPAVGVFGDVVVAAQGGLVAFTGGAAVGPASGVVDVTVDCWHATAGEDAGRVSGFHAAAE